MGTNDAAEAAILEGVAELITDAALRKKLEPASLRKYGMSGGTVLNPSIVCVQDVYSVLSKRTFRKPPLAGSSIEG